MTPSMVGAVVGALCAALGYLVGLAMGYSWGQREEREHAVEREVELLDKVRRFVKDMRLV